MFCRDFFSSFKLFHWYSYGFVCWKQELQKAALKTRKRRWQREMVTDSLCLVAGQKWSRHRWRPERWQIDMRPCDLSYQCQTQTEDSSGCLPRTAAVNCTDRERDKLLKALAQRGWPKRILIGPFSCLPVGLPNVQGVWVCDAPFVSLFLQEVKKVFNSQRRAVWRDAEDGLKEVIQELLKSSLWRKR